MKEFSPGFRFSSVDGIVLVAGVTISMVGYTSSWVVTVVVLWPLLNYFLFCNVFRLSRLPEIIWAFCFVILAGSTILFETPSWAISMSISFVSTILAIIWEIRRPCYHGILWQKTNPNLPLCWQSRIIETKRG
jgi:hypothetical protein